VIIKCTKTQKNDPQVFGDVPARLPDLKNDLGGEEGNKWGNVEDSNKENEIFKLTQ
jgi:hypothetical protein